MSAVADTQVVLGRISGAHGVKGWVKVYSETAPVDNILQYSPWYLRRDTKVEAFEVLEGRQQGKAIVARLKGINDRDQALTLRGAEITVSRDCLPATEPGEYYWADLEGLSVRTQDGVVLGVVDHLLETGANDVLVVVGSSDSLDQQERLIPFIQGQFVQKVDLEQGSITVDWDPEF